MDASLFLILRLLIAVALYLFLGWALYTLWRDMKRQTETTAPKRYPPLSLINPDQNQTFQFAGPEIILGRDPACDYCLEEKTVSLRHSRISYHDSQWWVEDLGSTNGTFINQDEVSEPMVITQGDRIRLGQVTLQVVLGGAGQIPSST
jgi:pSer/pThr/pTyr-binding forkhead associated (FHA) protein